MDTDRVRAAFVASGWGVTPEGFDQWLAEHDADVLESAWLAIHIQRFTRKPDTFYAGILRAKNTVKEMADRYRNRA